MDFETAVEELSFHSGTSPLTDDPRWRNGFLAMLRPYKGLRLEVFEHLMACVRSVAEHLSTAEELDRRVVDALWGICHYTRAWALRPGGMLRRNGLISMAEQATLEAWIEEISNAVTLLLQGGTLEEVERDRSELADEVQVRTDASGDRLFAAAIFESRALLSHLVGSEDESPANEAAALVYALHEDALCSLEGREVDVDAALERIRGWDQRNGWTIAERIVLTMNWTGSDEAPG